LLECRQIGETYSKVYYHSEAPKIETSPINPKLDKDKIAKAYFEGVDESDNFARRMPNNL
jgi:hypothetical protein